ncbi:MAG TPA: hypothetical protein DD636_06715 [Anaerolineaceae bacterium]|nr:hypothetical protein [Anaerolineaceae bacterium]
MGIGVGVGVLVGVGVGVLVGVLVGVGVGVLVGVLVGVAVFVGVKLGLTSRVVSFLIKNCCPATGRSGIMPTEYRLNTISPAKSSKPTIALAGLFFRWVETTGSVRGCAGGGSSAKLATAH